MKNKNNNFDHLIDEIGFIDDDIIASAVNSKKSKKIIPWKKISSIAACIVVVISSVYFGKKAFFNKDDESCGIFCETEDENKNGFLSEDDISISENDSSDLRFEENMPTAPNTSAGFSDSYFDPENSFYDGSMDGVQEGVEDENISDSAQYEEDESCEIYYPGIENQLNERVDITDLNKLAYYSGWTALRKYGNYNTSTVFSTTKSLKTLSSNSSVMIGYDNSDIEDVNLPYDSYFEVDSTWAEWETSDEFSGLIPVDPGFGGNVVAYSVYKLTVNSVEYFKTEMKSGGFLAEQIGNGTVEVMVLGVDIEGCDSDYMIVFKNGDRYFSCLIESFSNIENKYNSYLFSASKYVSNFNIVKDEELSSFTFKVNFIYNNGSVSDISFVEEYVSNYSYENYVSLKTYNFTNNLNISNTVMGLNEELYKLYLEDVAAGVIAPIMPEKPVIPETSESSDSPIGYHHEIPFFGCFKGEGGWINDPNFSEYGHEIVSSETESISYLKEMFPYDDFCQFIDNKPNYISYLVVWIRGDVAHSYSEWCLDESGNVIFTFDYVQFKYSDKYTVFLFEIEASNNVEKVILNSVDYSTTLTATFTTDNEYDYIDINNKTDEDEYIINLHSNMIYKLYKNGVLVYEGEYKFSSGFVCLCVPDDTYYLELSSEATFVYKLEGRNRIFKLI